MRDARSLELALAELAPRIAFPPTPPIEWAVTAAILAGERPAQRRGLFRVLAQGAAMGVMAALLVAGVTVGLGLVFGGLRIGSGPAPAELPGNVVSTRALGEATTLAEAPSQVSFAPLVPSLPALGDPDYVYVADPPGGGALALVWTSRSGYPGSGAGDVGVLITQFRGDIGSDLAGKWITDRVAIEVAKVGDGVGIWLSGGQHYFFYRDADGQLVDSTLRVVGKTLIWEQNGLTLRVEGAPSLDAALRIAASMQPLAD